MENAEVRDLGLRFVHNYAGVGRSEAGLELLSENFTAYMPARDEPIRGRSAHIEMNAVWHRAMPDFSYELEAIVVDGSQVVVRFHWHGTHTGGPLMDIAPSGRRIVVRNEVHWLEVRDGRLISDHALMELGDVVAQLRGNLAAGESTPTSKTASIASSPGGTR